MRPLLALILCLAGASARAELNTEGLPGGAAAVVGFDLAAFRATKLGQAIEQLADMKAGNLEVSRKFREQLGIDPEVDLSGFVVAAYPGADGKIAEKNASGIVLIRGKFLPATIDAFGEKHGLPVRAVGKHRAWEAAAFIEKLSGQKAKDNADEAFVVAHSEKLVIVAGAAFLERALAAADRGEKSAQLPAEVAASFASAQRGWLYLYADATKMPKAKQDVGAEDISVVLGENATDVQFATGARFVSPEKAAATLKQLQGLQAFAMIGLANDDGKSAEEKETMALLSDMVQKIRLGGEGRQVTLALDYPAEKMAQAVRRTAEKGLAKPAAK
jgi:hypothetical protein